MKEYTRTSIDAPNPYDEWQDKEARENGHKPKRALFCSPRTGKTKATSKSMLVAGIQRPLIVAPLSVCPSWVAELEGIGYTVFPLYDLPRPQLLNAMRIPADSPRLGLSKRVAFVIGWRRIASKTPDERKQKRKSAILEGLLRLGADGLVLDESHEMASPGSAQSKAARALAWATPWVRLLTGTPAPSHYGGLFCQLQALDPRPVHEGGFGKSWEMLAQRYLVRDTMYPSRVLGHIDTDDLQRRMLPFVTVKRREDIFGPDEWIENEVTVELPPAARKLYDKLAREWLIEEDTLQLTADHILTRMIRLQQIAAGYVTDDAGVNQLVHTAKLDELMHQLTNVVTSGEKAIVFHRFTWEGEEIAKRAGTLGVPTYRIFGETPAAERGRIVDAMARPEASVAVVQTQSGGVGISFAEVAYQFVMSEGYSFVQAEQAHDRTFKPNTQRFVTYIRAADTVDMFIASLLASKQGIHATIKNIDRHALAFGRIARPKLNQRVKSLV